MNLDNLNRQAHRKNILYECKCYCERRHFQQAIQEGQAIKEEVMMKNVIINLFALFTFIVAALQ